MNYTRITIIFFVISEVESNMTSNLDQTYTVGFKVNDMKIIRFGLPRIQAKMYLCVYRLRQRLDICMKRLCFCDFY